MLDRSKERTEPHGACRSCPVPARSIFSDPTEEERLYFEMIDRAVDSGDRRVISNGRPAHAVYILCKFLEIAQHRVVICTGRLRRAFNGVMAYEEPGLIDRTINFLRRGGTLDVLVLDKLDIDPGQTIHDHPLLDALSRTDLGHGRATISRFDGPLAGPDAYHFVVANGRAVRIEVNPEEAEAYVKLRDPNICAGLERVFGDRVALGERLLALPAD